MAYQAIRRNLLSAALMAAGLDRLIDEAFPDFLTDKSLLKAARAAYPRDYATFGFTDPA